MKKVWLSLLLIVAVIAATAVVTWAYFSSNDASGATTITTARIGIGESVGFPLVYDKILPGETQMHSFSVKNTGNRAADFYAQLVGEDHPDEYNFCYPGPLGPNALFATVYETTSDGTVINMWADGVRVCELYPGDHPGAKIIQIGNDVNPGERRYYRVDITLNEAAGNEYMDKTNTDIVNLIAVQYDGPAPKPDLDSHYSAWPVDIDDDDDPNYP